MNRLDVQELYGGVLAGDQNAYDQMFAFITKLRMTGELEPIPYTIMAEHIRSAFGRLKRDTNLNP